MEKANETKAVVTTENSNVVTVEAKKPFWKNPLFWVAATGTLVVVGGVVLYMVGKGSIVEAAADTIVTAA